VSPPPFYPCASAAAALAASVCFLISFVSSI
jgi:hypothetical protein